MEGEQLRFWSRGAVADRPSSGIFFRDPAIFSRDFGIRRDDTASLRFTVHLTPFGSEPSENAPVPIVGVCQLTGQFFFGIGQFFLRMSRADEAANPVR